MDECGQRSLSPVTFLVPLELDCHRNDDEKRQLLRDDNDWNDDDNDENSSPVDSTSKAGGQGSPTTTADAEGRSIPHGASYLESTLHHASGRSRESSPTIGTTKQCDITTEGDAGTPHTLPLPPSPSSSVTYQPSMERGVNRERGSQRPSRGSHKQLHYVNISSWRAYSTTIFCRPVCLSSACVGIALGGRGGLFPCTYIFFHSFSLSLSPEVFFFSSSSSSSSYVE